MFLFFFFQNRLLQEGIESQEQPAATSETNPQQQNGGHRRSHSTHLERTHSPILHQRSSSVAAERSAQRSNSLASGSPKQTHKRTPSDARSSPNSSLGRIPTQSTSSVFSMVNNKGYTVSPENSLRRAQQMDSSDLGSSIGDESQRNVLMQALVSFQLIFF